MRFTKLDGETWSPERAREIEATRGSVLQSILDDSVENPFSFGNTGNIVTVLFEISDASRINNDRIRGVGGNGLTLPFQTNHTGLYNLTDYSGKLPLYQRFLDIFGGKTEALEPATLSAFLREIDLLTYGKLTLEQASVEQQGYDHGHRRNGYVKRHRRRVTGSADEIGREFSKYPKEFHIDPDSVATIERRMTPDGYRYTAGLKVSMHRGLAGAPAINYIFDQKVIAFTGPGSLQLH